MKNLKLFGWRIALEIKTLEKGERSSLPKKTKETNSHTKSLGIFLISIGIVFMLIVLLLENYVKQPAEWANISFQLMMHIGIGLFVVGMMGILVELNHWRKYFEKRLAKITTDRAYLNDLNQEELITIQKQVLQAYFKDDAIGGTDGFLLHYQNNIQAIIGSPFRTQVNLDFNVEYDDIDEKVFKVEETLSWICKKNRGEIQEHLRWVPEEGEIEEIISLEAELVHSSFHSAPEHKIKYDYKALQSDDFSHGNGFKVSLKDYKDCEDLYITVRASYKIATNKFLAWRLSHPSKNIHITAHFPKNLSVFTEVFINEKTRFHEQKDVIQGNYIFNCSEWLMPQEGIAIQFRKIEKAAPHGHTVSESVVVEVGAELIEENPN